jgi:hypothetical protein
MKLRSLALAASLFLALPFASSFGQVGISINIAPPVLPVYEQPLCPTPGYIWTPGYWAWASGGYYWVPGVWVPPPRIGLLWTPAWWGWNNGVYVFHQGYWGPRVGFYGGINYGHGYWGDGYWGGRWQGNVFQYNTAVTRVNTTVIHNTYVNKSVVNRQVNRTNTSFNGPNGIKAKPTAEQKVAAQKRIPPTSQQLARQQAASRDRNLQASANNGKPNADAVKSFNKNRTELRGKAAEGRGAAAGAGAGQAGNKPGNIAGPGHKGAGQGAGAAAGAGQPKNKPVNMAERHGQGAGMNAQRHGNKVGTQNPGGNGRNLQGNKARTQTGKMTGHQNTAQGHHAMNRQMQPRQQMSAQHQQQMMRAQHQQQKMKAQPHAKMQGGGNRPHPNGQQQGKKKEGKGHR